MAGQVSSSALSSRREHRIVQIVPMRLPPQLLQQLGHGVFDLVLR